VHRPFVFNYTRRSREDIEQIGRWDKEHNGGRVVGAWRPFEHPQLGPVEIGGYDPRIGIWNAPEARIAELCDAHTRVLLRVASLAPRVTVTPGPVEPLGGGLHRVTAVVENRGYLPTYVLSSSRDLPWNDPLRARIVPGEGVTLAGGDASQIVGHLEGWGSYDNGGTPSFARTTATPVRARVSWVVRGQGCVAIEAGAARVGTVSATATVKA
jgi:hypothetical protein